MSKDLIEELKKRLHAATVQLMADEIKLKKSAQRVRHLEAQIIKLNSKKFA